MKASGSSRLIVSILVIAALAIAFWLLLLSPKSKEADELGSQVETLQVAVQEAQAKAAQAEAAKRDFPADYRQLVVLGQAVPAGDETSSLIVELNRIAERSKVQFDSLQLEGAGQTAEPVIPAEEPNTAPPTTGTTGSSTAEPAAETIPPTEASAALLPLGASVGPAGLGVMPYSVSFRGNFFHIADFMHGIDKMVHSGKSDLTVDGRLSTFDGFALTADGERGFPYLSANFLITTYVVPPNQGITAGATSTEPASAATPTSSTSEGSSEAAQ